MPNLVALHQSFQGAINLPRVDSRTQLACTRPIGKSPLTFFKWTLNVGKYASNVAIWRESGRYPLAVELTEHVYGYFERLEKMDSENSTAFVRHA